MLWAAERIANGLAGVAERLRRRRRRARPLIPALPWLPVLVGGLLLGAALTGALVSLWRSSAAHAAHPDPLRAAPDSWRWADLPDPAFPLPPYAKWLRGVKVVIDPGHVGQHDPGGEWKRGPTGLREADVNLAVARFLHEFLSAAGADALLTRTADIDLNLDRNEDLRQRAAVANDTRADLLLSVHHNAADDPRANHTLVFYHTGADASPASASAARHLLTGLNDALRLENQAGCAVVDDHAEGKDGLAVLRAARGPAVLSEASFHSNPDEEQRLRDPVYNRREAYGLFLGLARWAQAGLPRLTRGEFAAETAKTPPTLSVLLDDGVANRGGWGATLPRINPASVEVRLDNRPLKYNYDAARRRLIITLPHAFKGPAPLYIDFETALGQHVLHPWLTVGG